MVFVLVGVYCNCGRPGYRACVSTCWCQCNGRSLRDRARVGPRRGQCDRWRQRDRWC